MPRVCVFDVNETLLDLGALAPLFARLFGDAGARREWFDQVLRSALVATVTGAYSPFGAVGAAALEMVAARRGAELSPDDPAELSRRMRELPPHPDARAGLERLRGEGLRLAALTNGTLEVGEAQLEHAGLRDLFERVLSADTVKRFKPAPEPYRMAAESLGVGVGEVRLVAAHAWDVAGALRAACAAAFVARPGKVLDPLSERPDVVGADLAEVAARIVEVEAG